MKVSNNKGEQNTLMDALDLQLPDHAVISVTGAGGKTSLIYALAEEFAAAGKRVAVTTTTHMLRPAAGEGAGSGGDVHGMIVAVIDGCPDVPESPGNIEDSFASGRVVFAAAADPEDLRKVTAPPAEVFDCLYRAADVTLIEADGSRRLPLKWPAPWEPVVPEETDITICTAGLSALGCRTEDVVYRADQLPERLQRDVVDVNLIHAMLASREGGRKGARGTFRVFLNQVDDNIDRLAGAYRLQQILSVMGIQTAWGSLR